MEDDYPTEASYRQKWLDWRKNMPQERAMAAGLFYLSNLFKSLQTVTLLKPSYIILYRFYFNGKRGIAFGLDII